MYRLPLSPLTMRRVQVVAARRVTHGASCPRARAAPLPGFRASGPKGGWGCPWRAAGIPGFGGGGGGVRGYSTYEEGLAAQLRPIPEVMDAQKHFEAGKMALAVQALTRAAEITESSRMPELMVLSSEALAHVYQVSGDFAKEQVERSKSCQILADQLKSRDNDGATWRQEAFFNTAIQASLADITMGGFDETKTAEAREIAQRLGKVEDVELCGIVDTLGTWVSESRTEGEDVSFVYECVASCDSAVGNDHILTSQASLMYGIILEKNGQRDAALDYLQKSVDTTTSFSTLEDAGVRIETLQRLVDLAMGAKDMESAKEYASTALKCAESVNNNGLIASCVHTLAKVSIAQGDFVVGEGLLRTSMGRLQVPKGTCPSVWDLTVLQDATGTYGDLLDKLIFNNQSRKPEGDMARDRLATVEKEHPVCAGGVKRIREAGLGHWYRRYLAPKVPVLLREMP